ncbi:DUF4183 domain-containing protein [Bacillus thuringiensis]
MQMSMAYLTLKITQILALGQVSYMNLFINDILQPQNSNISQSGILTILNNEAPSHFSVS